MDANQIKFTKTNSDEFYKTLRKRVNQYFKDKEISRYGNANMVVKTIFMLSLYLVPFVLILTFVEASWLSFVMWALMGFGMAGIGLSVMHDANHSAYSKNKFVNVALGKVLYILGGVDMNWRIQHNVIHHTYTNVPGVDEDIDAGGMLRFSPIQKMKSFHKYQHIYAWFLYGLMTFLWITTKDYHQLKRYSKSGLLETQGITKSQMLATIIISKVFYYGVFMVLPLIFADVAWYITVLGFCTMHVIAGLTLASIFQPAHVVPSSTFPVPDPSGNIDADWAVSQLMNTANFAGKARMFSWYVGGLNYQIEHHLFPNICHVHYRKISKIVRDTAFEYNLPYYSYKTFFQAVRAHGQMLHKLGTVEDAPGLH